MVTLIFDTAPRPAQIKLLYSGFILTIWNRLRFAIADEHKASA